MIVNIFVDDIAFIMIVIYISFKKYILFRCIFYVANIKSFYIFF